MNLRDCLVRHESLARLDAADFDALENAIEVRDFPSGHPFIRQGAAADAVYFLLDGEVEIHVDGSEEADFKARHTMGPGEILGLVALVDGGPRSATCVSKGEIQVGQLPVEGARLLMHSHAPISCAFQVALARQLVHDARALNSALVDAIRDRLCT
jgi:CRP-like cAMP-binding protein